MDIGHKARNAQKIIGQKKFPKNQNSLKKFGVKISQKLSIKLLLHYVPDKVAIHKCFDGMVHFQHILDLSIKIRRF